MKCKECGSPVLLMGVEDGIAQLKCMCGQTKNRLLAEGYESWIADMMDKAEKMDRALTTLVPPPNSHALRVLLKEMLADAAALVLSRD